MLAIRNGNQRTGNNVNMIDTGKVPNGKLQYAITAKHNKRENDENTNNKYHPI